MPSQRRRHGDCSLKAQPNAHKPLRAKNGDSTMPTRAIAAAAKAKR